MIRTWVLGPAPRLFRTWRKDKAQQPPLTPVSGMRGFWGLMRAYWLSERWREAWLLTVAIALLSFTFLGDGLRDALDPKLKGKQ